MSTSNLSPSRLPTNPVSRPSNAGLHYAVTLFSSAMLCLQRNLVTAQLVQTQLVLKQLWQKIKKHFRLLTFCLLVALFHRRYPTFPKRQLPILVVRFLVTVFTVGSVLTVYLAPVHCTLTSLSSALFVYIFTPAHWFASAGDEE